jgi:hypothetical protein
VGPCFFSEGDDSLRHCNIDRLTRHQPITNLRPLHCNQNSIETSNDAELQWLLGHVPLPELHTYLNDQSKTLRMISGAPWCVLDQTLHEDLEEPFIQDMIGSTMDECKSRASVHGGRLTTGLGGGKTRESLAGGLS